MDVTQFGTRVYSPILARLNVHSVLLHDDSLVQHAVLLACFKTYFCMHSCRIFSQTSG